MELQIIETTETLTRVALEGRLDTPGVDAVEARFSASLAKGGDAIVDLSDVTFLASMGVRMLIAAAKMVARRGAKLVLVGPQPLVDQALRHSAIDRIIPVRPDLDGARALLQA